MRDRHPGRPAIVAASILLVLLQVLTAEAEHFINEWVAEVVGGRSVAQQVAEKHGYFLVDEIPGLGDHYVLKRRDVPHRSKRSAEHHTLKLHNDKQVTFVEQQWAKIRVKRDNSERQEEIHERWSRDLAREIVTKEDGHLNDPDFTHEWYFNPNAGAGINGNSIGVTDLRVIDVWKRNITGKNVVVTILDDGIESNHTDLRDNYDPRASYDINDNDTDPFPRYDVTNENKHGTRCAGEVAMVANNNNCGVGVAFDSKIGGIRLLDGTVTDRTEAFSLAYNRDYIDIYSASWGPNDDGKTTEKTGKLVSKALLEGVTKGRGGKGSIFAWASGNGGRLGDNCNSDGYASSPYTLSVSSATQYGHSPWYAEKCSSTLATTYSSGASNEMKVVSSDLHDRCTEQHTGTSAAAPMAAGIFALLLEANPDLTWRDVQHITVHSARMEPLRHEDGWYHNAAGYCINLAFGFGLMDALGMVEMADPAIWKSVGERHTCRVEVKEDAGLPRRLSSGNSVEVEFTTDACDGQKNEVNFLEHLEVVLDLRYERRGVIYVELESPSGTVTSLMQERHYDSSTSGFQEFPLMSVHTWGEDPSGTWKFRVADNSKGNYTGELKNVKLVLYGTKEKPKYRELDPKTCKTESKMGPTKPMTVDNQPTEGTLRKTLEYLTHASSQKSEQTQERFAHYIKELERAAKHSAREDFMNNYW